MEKMNALNERMSATRTRAVCTTNKERTSMPIKVGRKKIIFDPFVGKCDFIVKENVSLIVAVRKRIFSISPTFASGTQSGQLRNSC